MGLGGTGGPGSSSRDTIGFGDWLDTWLPKKLHETVSPVIDKAQNTLDALRLASLRRIANQIGQSQVAQQSFHNSVMDRIDSQLQPVEARLDSAQRKVLNAIDLDLLPKEVKALGIIPIAPGQPVGAVGGQCPPGYELTGSPVLEVDPITHLPVPKAQGCIPIAPGTSIQGILDNQPCEPCPPIGDCPIPVPCPPCPGMVPFDIYLRWCKDQKDKCMYAVPFGHGPLSKQDRIVASDVPCDTTLLNIFAQEKYQCPMIPDCKPTGKDGCCIIENIQAPCPNQIINIQPPPGGQIINEPNPTMPIENYPNPPVQFPPYTQVIPPGSMVNIALLAPPQGGTRQQCFPNGDMAYFCMECTDGSKLEASWKDIIGQSPSSLLNNQLPYDWIKEKMKDLQQWVLPLFSSGDDYSDEPGGF